MTTSTWNVSASGDWSDASDWTGGVPDSSTATATIAKGGRYTVDIASTETFSVDSITLDGPNATLEIDGTLNLAGTLTLHQGYLDITGTLNLAGTITEIGGEADLAGTINGGTIDTGLGGAALSSYGGTLNGVSVEGTILDDHSSLTLTNGISMHGAGGTGNGTIFLAGISTYLIVDGTVSNATIDASDDGATGTVPQNIVDYQDNGTITFASTTIINSSEYDTLTINGGGGSIVNNGAISASTSTVTIAAATITNTGTIDDTDGSDITITANNFNNSGTIALSEGAVLEISSASFTNTGSISVDGTSGLIFQSAVTTAELGTLDLASGASLDFSAGLDNTGATLSVAGGLLLGQVDGGTIEGTIDLSNSSIEFIDKSLTLSGDVSFEGAGGAGAGTIDLTGNYGNLVLSGPMTLSNVTINFDAGGYDSLTISPTGTGTVTLASSVTIDIAANNGQPPNGNLIGESSGSPEGVIVSYATINDTTSGAQLTIYQGSFTNAGTINVSNDNEFDIGEGGGNTTGFTNTGTIDIDDTSTVSLSETDSVLYGTIGGSGTLALSGGSVTLGSGVSLGVANWSLASGAEAILAANAAYAGDLTEAAGTTIALGAYTLSLSGAGSSIAGTIRGPGTLALAGGSQTLNAGAAFSLGSWTISDGDTVNLDTNVNVGGVVSQGVGTTLAIASGDTLTVTGEATIAGTVSGAGTLALTHGGLTVTSGASLTVANVTLSGAVTMGIRESLTYGGTLSVGSGSDIAITPGDTLTLSGTATFAGGTSGSGILLLSAGSDTADAGVKLASALTLANGATLAIDGAVSASGTLSEATGTTFTIGAGDTLSLSGSASRIAGTVSGAGTLNLSGGGVTFAAGTNLSVADWTLSSGGKATIGSGLTYGGVLTEASGATLTVSNALTLTGTGTVLSGAIGGTAALILSNGSQAIDSGAALTTARWELAGSDTVAVNESTSYAGIYTQLAGTTLTVAAGDTLSLTGTATLEATINGAGTVNVSSTTVAGLVLGGTMTLNDVGTISQTGALTLGDTSANAVTLSIGAAGSYDIAANVGIAIGASPSSAIDDNGLLIKSGGTGTSAIAVGIVDNGHIEASTGTLDLMQAVTGSGAMQVDAGATLEFGSSAASTLAMTFNGANATLALAIPSSFAATISDFAAGDDIDLLKITATSAVLENGDQLLITKGHTTIATLQLSGSYTGYTFGTVSDGHGGTDITATAPQSHATVEFDALATATLRQFDTHLSDWHLG